MRNLYSSFRYNSIFTIILLFILLSSCSQKINFEQSVVDPSARGQVKIKVDNNKNYSVSINTLHLAEPKRMQPPGNTYVVWMETNHGDPKNIGQIQSTTGFLSKALKGSLKAVTTIKPGKIFITVEDEAAITYPKGQVVLTTKDFGKE